MINEQVPTHNLNHNKVGQFDTKFTVHLSIISNIKCFVVVRCAVSLAGFSMGGALALHYGYGHRRDLAGVIAMSSFLNDQSTVYDVSKENILISLVYLMSLMITISKHDVRVRFISKVCKYL